jgi:ABC-type lipoprotein release transport system permease subunit
VGAEKIWVNRDYISEVLDLDVDTYTYLSVACGKDYNSTEIALNLLESGGEGVVYTGDWTTVDREFDAYIAATTYELDRSIDSMMTVGSVFVVLGVLTVYTLTNMQGRKRETALLRAMGADSGAIVRIHISEFLATIMLTLAILALYAPLFISNSMSASINAYRSWAFTFPVAAFPVIPWASLVLVIAINIGAILVFAFMQSVSSSRVQLCQSLANSWAIGGPQKNQDVR